MMWTYAVAVLCTAAVFLDVWLTDLLLDDGAREANPVLRYAMGRFGRGNALVLSTAWRVVLVWALAFTGQAFLLFVLTAIMFGVVVWNVLVYGGRHVDHD